MRGDRLWDEERLGEDWRGDGGALEFPLFCSGAETTRFAYAVFLLNKARHLLVGEVWRHNHDDTSDLVWIC